MRKLPALAPERTLKVAASYFANLARIVTAAKVGYNNETNLVRYRLMNSSSASEDDADLGRPRCLWIWPVGRSESCGNRV